MNKENKKLKDSDGADEVASVEEEVEFSDFDSDATQEGVDPTEEAGEEIAEQSDVSDIAEEDIVVVDASAETFAEIENFEESDNDLQASADVPKKKMSRSKKIAFIIICSILGLALLIATVGAILFFHFYGKLNYQDRDDSTGSDEYVLRLKDVNTGELYRFTVDISKLSDKDSNTIVNWHTKNWELPVEVGIDPAKMTETERQELLKRVLAAIDRELQSDNRVQMFEVTVIDAQNGAEIKIMVDPLLLANEQELAVLAEYAETEGRRALLYFDGDLGNMEQDAQSKLYTKLAQAVLDMEKTVAVIRLQGPQEDDLLLFAIYRTEVDDAVLAEILKREAPFEVSSMPGDPALLTEEGRKAIIDMVTQTIKDSGVRYYTLKLRDSVSGKLYDFVLTSDDLEQGQLKPISAQILKGELKMELPSDPNELSAEEKKALILRIIEKIEEADGVKSVVLDIKNVDGTPYTLVIAKDRVSSEQWMKLLKPGKDTVFVLSVEKDPQTMNEEEFAALVQEIISFIDNMNITHYRLTLKGKINGQAYDFEIAENEVSEEELPLILRQIQRGALLLELTGDPNRLDAFARKTLIDAILHEIEELENPVTEYSITVADRKTNKKYQLVVTDKEITEEQLVLLLELGENAVVTIFDAADPALMSQELRKAFIESVFEEIQHPTRALALQDTATQKSYTLYFRDKDVSVEQLSVLIQQINSTSVLKIAVTKDPLNMTAEEKAAFIAKVVETILKPATKEYSMQLRDVNSGNVYTLVFTKEEVNDSNVFGYLLVQSQKGSVLNCNVAADPATMSAKERKTLFGALADLIKNPPKEEDDPEALEKLKEHLANMAQNPIKHTEDIYNVLLVGTDERGDDPSYARNSDTMILVTVNYKDGTITLTSLLRDTYVEYTYYTSNGVERTNQSKLNSAYAVGGIKALISAIEKNYGVIIDNYVKVNWFSFVDIFEVLGGIDVNVNAKHLETVNLAIKDTCRILGVEYEGRALSDGGYQHLDPYQTLAYVRYRVDDADFGRTARQREVLSILFDKFKKSSLGKINDILNTVLPLLTTDLTPENCASLLLDFSEIIGFKMQQVRLPEWQEYTNYKGMLVLDWDKTLRRLFKNAYGSLCPAQYK